MSEFSGRLGGLRTWDVRERACPDHGQPVGGAVCETGEDCAGWHVVLGGRCSPEGKASKQSSGAAQRPEAGLNEYDERIMTRTSKDSLVAIRS